MILQSLELRNFRGFRDIEIDFDQRLTVLVGINGAGKTTVLDALAVLLDQYTARLIASRSTARRLKESDTTNGAPEAHIRLTVEGTNGLTRWALRKQGKRQKVLRPISSELGNLNDLVHAIAESSEHDEDYLAGATLPIYYDQRRALVDIPQRKRSAAKHLARDAFAESRGRAGLDFRGFVYWFEERESEELRRQRRDRKYEDAQLGTVRRAIAEATGLTGLTYRSIPPRGLLINKGGVELRVEQLSAGERVFLAMAGDLARRLAMLSARTSDARFGRAIVLIDEVELHLHPRWQRSILPWLLKAFPNCQFVVTTHSPQVIGEVEASHIRVLQYHPSGNRIDTTDASFGRDSNYLLLSVFDAGERSASSKQALEKFEAALNRNDLTKAHSELEELEHQIEGSAPELAIAKSRYERRVRSKP
jgi:predicted ATP-binding protein involved in virulence